MGKYICHSVDLRIEYKEAGAETARKSRYRCIQMDCPLTYVVLGGLIEI